MNPLVLYLLLLKATLTSFSGLSSLPLVHRDLVVERGVLTERQLTNSVAIARVSPGPFGLYVVAVGYFAGGIPGALAGFLAMLTPAYAAVLLVRYVGKRADSEDVKRAIRALLLGAAGLVLAATLPLARDAVTSTTTALLAAIAFLVLGFTKLDTLWVIAGSAAVGLLLPV